MQTIGRIVGHLLEADAAGAGPAICNLDGADHEYLALMTAPAAASQGIVLVAADDLGFGDLDEPGQGAAVAGHHAAPQLGTQQPGRFVGAEAELALQLQRRDAVGMGSHQIGGPEPQGQRQLGVVHDSAGGDRGLLAAMGAFPGPCLGLQRPGFAPAASGADKTLWPARREKIFDASRLIRKAALKLNQGVRKIRHGGSSGELMFAICSIINRRFSPPLMVVPDARG